MANESDSPGEANNRCTSELFPWKECQFPIPFDSKSLSSKVIFLLRTGVSRVGTNVGTIRVGTMVVKEDRVPEPIKAYWIVFNTFCFSCWTVNQSSRSRPPVSPEFGLRDQNV